MEMGKEFIEYEKVMLENPESFVIPFPKLLYYNNTFQHIIGSVISSVSRAVFPA